MISKKMNLWPFLALFCGILMHSLPSTAITYTYYPTYGIVTGTTHNILTITYPVAKALPDEVGQQTVIGYVKERDQKFALVLDVARSENMQVDVENMARGMLRGKGVPVADAS